jgi:nitrite reductase (NADH) large subunit
MQAEGEPPFFRSFLQQVPKVPASIWIVARMASVATLFAVIAGLIFQPEITLLAFWGVLVPACPAIFILAPGLWRQVCPFAAANQLPKALRLSAGRDLPKPLANAAWTIAITVFIAAILLRGPYFNEQGALLAAVLTAFFLLALVGGFIFKGRSGWCGTFCPLGPIQRVYGHAPAVVVRNGHCSTCVGCQSNCYDFNPRAAIFKDIYAENDRHSAARRFFSGLLPGLIVGYFLQTGAPVMGESARVMLTLLCCLVSVGLYQTMATLTRLTLFQVANLYAGLSIVLFYFFAGPILVASLTTLTGLPIPAELGDVARMFGMPLALSLAYMGLRNERHYKASPKLEADINEARQRQRQRVAVALGQGPKTNDPAAPARAARPAKAGAPALPANEPAIHDLETGKVIPVRSGQTLLGAIEGAGLDIRSSCKSGMCGMDAVLVTDGMEHLSAPGDIESETLRRMGLEGKARLACMCRTKGPVSIHRDPKAKLDVPAAPAAECGGEKEIVSGLTERVVIVGNGSAGMTAALGLRRRSPGADISVVTLEPVDFYNRMGIAEVIYDRQGLYRHYLVESDWQKQNRVQLWRNTLVTEIDRANRRVRLAGNDWLSYDWLILATGARARLPHPDFLEHPNGFVLRSADDASSIRAWCQAQDARRAVVIGGGTLGIEVSDALQKLGLEVEILHRGRYLMDRHLDEAGAQRLRSHLGSAGIQTRLGAAVEAWEGGPGRRITAVRLKSGERVEADLFIACIGVEPNIELAREAGLAVGRGIRVDRAMRTSDPRVLAIGDAAELAGEESGFWGIATRQAEIALGTIHGDSAQYTAPELNHMLKLEGIDVTYFGDVHPAGGAGSVLLSPPHARAWWRICKNGTRILGASYVGPPNTASIFVDVLRGAQPPEALAMILAGHTAVTPAQLVKSG